MRKKIIAMMVVMLLVISVSSITFASPQSDTDDRSVVGIINNEEQPELIFRAVQDEEIISEVSAGEIFTVEVIFDEKVNFYDYCIVYNPDLFELISEKSGFSMALTNPEIPGEYYSNMSTANPGGIKAEEGMVTQLKFKAKTGNAVGAKGNFELNFATPFNITNETFEPNPIESDYINQLNDGIKIKALFGDVDLNGAVELGDAVLAKEIATKQKEMTDPQLAAGDYNGDGKITINEARKIKQMVMTND